MTDAPLNGHALLDFNTPLSDAKAYDLINGLRLRPGDRIADYGCGWAELLLRAVEHQVGVTGVGVDSDDYAITRGRGNVQARGLTSRVTLDLADVTGWAAEGLTDLGERMDEATAGARAEFLERYGKSPALERVLPRVRRQARRLLAQL